MSYLSEWILRNVYKVDTVVRTRSTWVCWVIRFNLMGYEISCGDVLGRETKSRSRFMQSLLSMLPCKTIRANPEILCEMYDFMNSSVDPRINSPLFSYIFKRANIFSFIDFLPHIFTSQCSFWCWLSNQGYYFEFHFLSKISQNPFNMLQAIML